MMHDRDMSARPARKEIASLSLDDCRLLVSSVADYAIFMLDPTGHIATWNLGAQLIKGWRADEIIGHHFSEFYPQEDIDRGKPDRELEEASRVGRVEDEGWRLRKDGTRFWANVVITALRDETGELRGFAKVTRDLTERRAMEETLRKSEERFRLLVEAVADYAIYMLDPEGIVTTWNLGAERMKGYEAAEILGTHFSRFFPEADRRNKKPERELEIARDVGRYEDEGWRVRKNGELFWANVVVTALRDTHGELVGYAKVTRDLTLRKQAEETERNLLRAQAAREAAENLAAKADEANRIKDEFLATVSHELRTPLNAILGWARLLRQRPLEPTVAKGLDVIDRNAEAQVKLIEDILDVSRIVTGKLRIDARPTDLVAITREAIEVIKPSAAAKEITIELVIPSEGAVVVGDGERLRQVAWNILSNAVKFTDKRGTIRIAIVKDASKVTVTVADTGRGIPGDFLPYVFDRFKQADASTTRRYGGLGLGLALVRHIVELHGGSVRAASDGPGRGATFEFAIPVKAMIPPGAAAPDAKDRAALSAKPPPLLDGLRVLLVDDDPDALELLTTVLGSAGAAVRTATSAECALDSIRQFRPHVLVSDIGMPDEDGYSLIRRLRVLSPEEGGNIPSIALTAYTRGDDRTRALAAGFTTHIGKPVGPTELVQAVANLAPFARR
jgi:PAS domain S-box-containing protein